MQTLIVVLQVFGVKMSAAFNSFEPAHEKTNNLVFRSGQSQTRLYEYSHRCRLET